MTIKGNEVCLFPLVQEQSFTEQLPVYLTLKTPS